jgi:hypothetical protein
MYEIRCIWKKNEILIETLQNVKYGDLIGLRWDATNVHIMTDKNKINPNEIRI